MRERGSATPAERHQLPLQPRKGVTASTGMEDREAGQRSQKRDLPLYPYEKTKRVAGISRRKNRRGLCDLTVIVGRLFVPAERGGGG